MLSFILVRAGLKLEVISRSTAMTDYYPDFSINPGMKGDGITQKLLSFVPDLLYIEGDTAYLLDPIADDATVYAYAAPQNAAVHTILEGYYRFGTPEYNHIQVDGFDSVNRQDVVTHSFDWEAIAGAGERYHLQDINIGSESAGKERGETILRRYDMESAGGYIKIPELRAAGIRCHRNYRPACRYKTH
jgi:hypothetical protein